MEFVNWYPPASELVHSAQKGAQRTLCGRLVSNMVQGYSGITLGRPRRPCHECDVTEFNLRAVDIDKT